MSATPNATAQLDFRRDDGGERTGAGCCLEGSDLPARLAGTRACGAARADGCGRAFGMAAEVVPGPRTARIWASGRYAVLSEAVLANGIAVHAHFPGRLPDHDS